MRMGWAEHVACIGARRNACRILVVEPERKRPRRRWKDNIKMDLTEIRRGSMDWIDVVQDRDRWRALLNAVKYFRES
jgi:hypothetical protein